jgi:hypothetical protein
MMFWIILAAYEAVWLGTVSGAGHGREWPGVMLALLFTAWRLSASRHRRLECGLMSVSLLMGITLETLWVRGGWLRYAAARPWPTVPVWILGLWICFAQAIVPLFGYLQNRPWLAALIGALGGPLSYAAAANAWHALAVSPPAWQAYLLLALGWGIALPVLTTLARIGLHRAALSQARRGIRT